MIKSLLGAHHILIIEQILSTFRIYIDISYQITLYGGYRQIKQKIYPLNPLSEKLTKKYAFLVHPPNGRYPKNKNPRQEVVDFFSRVFHAL